MVGPRGASIYVGLASYWSVAYVPHYAGGNHYASRLEGGRILYFRGNFQKPGLRLNALFLVQFLETLAQPKQSTAVWMEAAARWRASLTACLSETIAGRVGAWALLHGSGFAAVGADCMPYLLTWRPCHAAAWTLEHVSHDSCTCSRWSSLQGCAAYSFTFGLSSQVDGPRAGPCGFINRTVVGSGCGRVIGDRFPCFCLYRVLVCSVYLVSPRLVRWPMNLAGRLR